MTGMGPSLSLLPDWHRRMTGSFARRQRHVTGLPGISGAVAAIARALQAGRAAGGTRCRRDALQVGTGLSLMARCRRAGSTVRRPGVLLAGKGDLGADPQGRVPTVGRGYG